MSENMKGTALLKNIPSFLEWYAALEANEAEEINKHLMSICKKRLTDLQNSPVTAAINEMFIAATVCTSCFDPSFLSEVKEKKWTECRKTALEKIRQFLAFSQEFEQPLRVGEWVPGEFAFLFMGNPNKGIIILHPEKYLEYMPERDYSDMTPAQLQAESQAVLRGQGTSIVPKDMNALSPKAVSGALSLKKAEMEQLKQKADDIKNAREESLARLKREIEEKEAQLKAKQEALMSELSKKKKEMEQMVEQMENQLYLLDSQIYAIRCYSGEVVQFSKIRSGENAADSEPVVIHQKLRFLDEDLGRLASLYEIQWDELNLFEEFLKYSPSALDTFAPNDRCVVLVRLSRNNRQYGAGNDNLLSSVSNMLKTYNYYHGNTIGIIIRNGGNLYLGWTDNKRVHIQDDVVVTQVFTETVPMENEPKSDRPIGSYEEKLREEKAKKEKMERKEFMDGIISRLFIYNILQGIVDNSSILPLPAGAKVTKESEYVIYAVADRWLTDNRFGSFTEIIEKCNRQVTKGDMLLTVQRLVPERNSFTYYHFWQNVRGRGEANRTHDCTVEDCTLYPANLVEYDTPLQMVRYRWESSVTGQGKHWAESCTPKENAKNLSPKCEILEEYEEAKRHVFVSIRKREGSWCSDTESRANFEVYDREFINLTYMNSVWLEWVISNKTLGNWSVGGQIVDYAYAIRYLKTAMDYIRRRELHEKACIDSIDLSICTDPEWPLRLTEWKMSSGVRAINAYQAKRFVKHYQTNRQK